MTALFRRYIGVTVGREGEEGRLFDDLFITFDLERTTDSAANKGIITIYNLNSESISLIQDEGAKFSLKAGYLGLGNSPLIEELSSGDIEEIKNEKKGVDKILTFTITEDGKKLRDTTIEKSFGEGISKKQIINSLVDTLGVAKGAIEGLTDKVFNSGYSATGKVKDRLDELTKNDNLEWSVQNGELQILPKGQATLDEVIVLNYETGLLKAYRDKSEGQDKVVFEALLNPELKVGRRVQIQSDEVNGIFTIKKCRYYGDNKTGPFNAKGEVE